MSYVTQEKYASLNGIGSGPRVFPESIQPKTFASGSGTIAKMTLVTYNTNTNKWEVFKPSTTGSNKTVITVANTTAYTSGNFTLTVNGEATANIAYNASLATIRAALLALGNIDDADLDTTTGNGSFNATGFANANQTLTLTFQGQFLGKTVTMSKTDAVGGLGLTLTTTTDGGALYGRDQIQGIAWPEDIVLSGSGEVLGNVMLKGKVHVDDIVAPAGESANTLKPFLRDQCRRIGILVESLPGAH